MTELILAGLLIATNAGWMLFTHRLLNKFMSRSFHEYVHAKAPPEPSRRIEPDADPEMDMGTLGDFIGS